MLFLWRLEDARNSAEEKSKLLEYLTNQSFLELDYSNREQLIESK